MRTVDLVALHQTDVLQAGRNRLDRINNVDEHGKVGWHQFGPGWPVLVRGVEDMRHLGETAKLLAAVVPIKQINCHVPDAIPWLSVSPRQADNIPVSKRCKMIDEVATDDSLGSDDQGDLMRFSTFS